MFANALYFSCRAISLQYLIFYFCLDDNLNIKCYLHVSHDIQTCLKYCKPRCDTPWVRKLIDQVPQKYYMETSGIRPRGENEYRNRVPQHPTYILCHQHEAATILSRIADPFNAFKTNPKGSAKQRQCSGTRVPRER
jgi:hypothetical protein